MRSILSATRFALATHTAQLCSPATFKLHARSRTALVGRNGSGKSTLLEVIYASAVGAPLPEHVVATGSLWVDPGTRVGLLPQAPPALAEGLSVAGYLDRCSSGLTRAHSLFVGAGQTLDADQSPAALAAYAVALDTMEVHGAWDFASRRDMVLSGLIGGVDVERPITSLSGGETTKVALAGLLIGEPDLLLLDEPTNNLDVDALDFVRHWLRDSSAAMLVVSHDRDFLDATVDSVLAIDEHSHAVRQYGGNYTAFAAARRVEFDAEVRQYQEHEDTRARLVADSRRIDRVASSFQRTQNDYVRARGKKVARRAVVQRARVERTLDRLDEPLQPRQPHIDVAPPAAARDARLLGLRDAVIEIAGMRLLTDVTLSVSAGQRIAILGANGSGKTTLLRVLAGELSPGLGTIWRSPDLRSAYLTQLPPPVRRRQTAVAFAREQAPISESDAGALLGKVLFDDVGRRSVDAFSVGERRRIELAVLFATAPNLLFLDEPTNHLDLPTIEMLEAALAEYRGAVMAVSHDRRFLEHFNAQVRWELGDGALRVTAP